MTLATEDPERKRELAVGAFESFEVARDEALDHLQAQVYIEGPQKVIDRVINLSMSLTEYENSVLQITSRLVSGEECEQILVERMRVLHDTAHRDYLHYLYEASSIIGDDGGISRYRAPQRRRGRLLPGSRRSFTP
ncbi:MULTISPECIES: hypothetical protein [unclassified Streptomyces]|uniref:hypothetical protein n=1 Tax=unclassified Streptomyces TaxID=2593676 RepID=UPI00226F353C|nr:MULTISPECIES: hypothetical protein [unclassified Streptomyces]MCY0920013.1 hypothetical protein [Streptomyces sp. H27-G5]MCY0959557.1 hypothetical protein [Streptomyces sp. H27-H5]